MPINIAFAGASIRRPGAYSTVDTSGMVPVTLGASNVLAVIGAFDADAEIATGKVNYFNDPAEARKKLKRGAVLKHAEKAWEHGADLIAIVGLGTNKKATGALGTAFDVEAKIYGAGGNQIKVEYDNTSKTIYVTRGEQEEVYPVGTASNAEIAAAVTKNSNLIVLKKKTDTAMSTAVPATALSGGAGAASATDSDWQTAIDLLQTEDIQGIIPVSTEGAIIAKTDAHIKFMSSVKNRKERRGFYGHEVGASKEDIFGIKAQVNNERGMVASPGPVDFDETGAEVEYDSTLLAAAYAGTWAGKEPQDPITYDYVSFAGLSKEYSSAEIEDYLANGIAVSEVVKGRGYRIVQAVTTDNGPDLSKNELSVSTLKDVMSRNMREHLEEKFVGKAATGGIDVTIYNDAMTMIQKFKTAGWISEYVDGSLNVVQDGTSFRVDWEGKPTLPINNFLITSHFTI